MAAAPLKPKDPKPMAEEAGGGASSAAASPAKGASSGGLDMKFIITILVTVLSNVLCIGGAIYFLAPMVLVPAITSQLPKAEAGEGEGGDHAAGGEHGAEGEAGGEHAAPHQAIGLNYPLEEFTVNLKSSATSANTFARLKLAFSVGVPEPENCLASHAEGEHKAEEAAEGGHGGGHGGGGAAPAEDPCMKAFTGKMTPFLPTIRDIVNSSLMKRTAQDLSTPDGQEAFKDEVKEQVDHVIGSQKYSVQRINFEDFIIQR